MTSCLDEAQIPAKFNWIFSSPDGYRFLCKFSFDNIDGPEETIFHHEVNPLDTLSMVHRVSFDWFFQIFFGTFCEFFFHFLWISLIFFGFSEIFLIFHLFSTLQHYTQHLTKCTLQSLIGDTCITNGEISLCENSDATLLNDVLKYAQLLTESKSFELWEFPNNCKFQENSLIFLISSFAPPPTQTASRDELTLWWTKLFCIDALWLLGNDVGAEKLFESARKIPKSLFDSKDTLSRSAIIIFCAKKLLA